VIVVEGVQLETDLVVVAYFQQKLQARRVLLLVVDVRADAVGDVAVVIRRREREPGGQTVGQGAADGALALDRAEVTAGDLEVAVGVVGRRRADVLDESARGVAAEQCALGPTQYLDTLQVEQ
jgi:hypothetical protein